jgi:hypothetical protein
MVEKCHIFDGALRRRHDKVELTCQPCRVRRFGAQDDRVKLDGATYNALPGGEYRSSSGLPDFVFKSKIHVFLEIKTFFYIKYNIGAGKT